ncbi:MAG: TIGR01212 family radical SAM protein [Candidatus Cloacimonadota bacterium]|nr:MAG: TIGR01212 family radical SAM protein [Candidatus Cloacimonadota bacterium]
MEQRLNQKINLYSDYLIKKYGQKVFRAGVSAGIVCPHRVKKGGCVFCNPETFTGDYQSRNLSVTEQLKEVTSRIKASCGDVKFLAYFQDETSTAGNPEVLKAKYEEALSFPEAVGLVVSTRPDALSDEIINILQKIPEPVTVEIGLQSVHDKSLAFLNRGHDFKQADTAIKVCGEAGLQVGVHLIWGIPGETFQDMKETICYVSDNPFIKQVKFHNLIIYKNTELAKYFSNEDLPSIDEYIDLLCDLLPYLKGNKIITRLFTSNVKKNQLASGVIKGNKTKWMNQLRMQLYAENILQGSETDTSYVYEK